MRGRSKGEREEAARQEQVVKEFMALSDKEKIERVIDLDRLARSLAATTKNQQEKHKAELLMQSRGRTVDAITRFTMERLNKDHDRSTSRVAALEVALKEIVTEAIKSFPKNAMTIEKIEEIRKLLGEKVMDRPTPTPGKELMNFVPSPPVVTAKDLVLAVEEALGTECPDTLRFTIEHAMENKS